MKFFSLHTYNVLLLCIVLAQLGIQEASGSMRPIIITDLPETITIDLKGINLTFYIIDDNIKNYFVYINGNLWQNNISLNTDNINLFFSNVAGTYYMGIVVYDYSGFSASKSIIIKVVESTSSITNPGSQTSYDSNHTAATPDFSVSDVVIILGLMALIAKRKYKNRQKK